VQIILVSRHLKAARTITIMPRHVAFVLAFLVVLVFSTSALFSWLSVHLRLPIVEELVLSLRQKEAQETRDHLSNNLQLMATRLGELQAQVLQLDVVSDRVAGLAGVKRDVAPIQTQVREGLGGPYSPAPLDAEALQREIDRLVRAVEARADELVGLESQLLEKRVRDRLLPTTLPVKEASLGSAFGYRSDPVTGSRAMHEGLDFNAPPGTPIMAAADGIVRTAEFHPEYGNMVEIDHGDGLSSRYAHMQRLEVAAGALVKRGQTIGALGSTGRSTGPHLHFEVRMLGAPQNPLVFLKRGQEYAQLKSR
jgi:murein DD-endopeptidase MepM/ murein hydrolase activator NlpD